MVIAILTVMVLSSALVVAAPAHVAGRITPASSCTVTPCTVTFTGNPAADFPSNALLYTNHFSSWGPTNNLTGLYGTWDASNLYLGLSGINASGANSLLFAVSNNSAWGTTNLSNLAGVPGVSYWNRSIDFTQPMNFLFIVNSSGKLSSFEVTSQPGAATTTVTTLTPTAVDNAVSSTGVGNLEIALSFSAIVDPVFPKFANVSLYAGIFGGSGPWVGPTIPSGQDYDVTWEGSYQLTSHDRPGPYDLENTFYRLGLDPQGLGTPDSGITPNYLENDTFHTVTFTGNPSTDFAPGEQALINTNTMWGGSNLLNSSYITWNETTLFLGFESLIQGNYFYFFIGNNTGTGLGTYTLNTTNDTSLNRPIVFTQAINFIGVVHFAGVDEFTPVYLYEVNSSASTSNTSVTVKNVTGLISGTSLTTAYSTEIAIPFTLLYGRPASWPVIGMFANVSMVAAVVGGSGPSTGPTLPAGQGYAYTGYYNTNHTVGQTELLNTFFTENLDPYGDGVPAAQINPTYTYGHTYHSVKFTGTITKDFVPPEIVGTSTWTGWSSSNLVNATYATWNYTDLFIGTNSTVASGNWFLVAISNDTAVGATNFSSTNVLNLSRNFTFETPVNFVFDYSGGAPNGTLYEVVLSGTSATHTQFTNIASIPRGKDGDEFAIPFSLMYPTHPSAAGADAVPCGVTPQLVAFIYGGPGAYIGPTIPSGQNFSQSKAGQYAPIGAYESLRIDPNKDGYAEPGIVPSAPAIVYAGAPISLNIVFNDHQPLYAPVGESYLLPWAVVHLEEYLEQALIAGMYPGVRITYSLSGSLLYQIEAVAHGDYNNSYLEAASIPTSQWGNTVYTEVNTYGDTFLNTFVQPYQYNSTTVASVLENDLAFNSPPWTYYVNNNASKLYLSLYDMWTTGKTFTTAQLEEALVEFFLWSTSEPVVTGQLGVAYINSTMWSFYNDTSFTIGDIQTIQAYYPYEARMVLSAFSHDRMLNDGAGGNVELITTPFDHPILPLLLLGNWTDENGAAVTKGIWTNDTLAQLQVGSELYNQTFGQAPLGLWSPEQAVSAAEIPLVNETGYKWTASSQATLYEAGKVASDSSPVTASQMEALYTPYLVKNGSQSTVMVFRDDGLSNDWGFNYGTIANQSGSAAAVKDFIDYLKNVYATVPRADHSNILVTVALDGENWMFMGSTGNTFPEDGVPFLQDLYASLTSNSSWLSTNTTQQYLVTHPASTLPTITNLLTGSWNDQPTVTGVNSYLGQWAGNPLQDSTWIQLALVRSMVQAFGTANGLTQPTTLAQIEAANNFPYLNQWNSTTLQDKYTEAWTAIYGVEGSDIYYAFSPDQSATAQNAIVFEVEVRSDLSLALTLLGLPLTPFLKSPYIVPESPTTWGTNASISPTLSGSLYTTEMFPGGLGYSVNHNNAWAGSYVKATGNTTAGSATIVQTNYAFDVSNLYFSVKVNGPTSAYKAPTFYTPASDALDIFFSGVNPGQGNLLALNVPDSVYTVGNVPFGFASTTKATIEGNSITPTGSATMALFTSAAGGTWVASSTLPIAGDAWVGSLLQLQVPMSDIGVGMQPGYSIEFSVAVVNGTTGAVLGYSGPMLISVPASLAKLTVISTIHNTAAGNGPGTSTYPTQWAPQGPDFPADSMTIRWFQVAMNPYTVQFNVTFGNLSNPFGGAYGFSQPMIDVYIHVAGATGGSTAGLTGSEINISSADAWQYAVQASGYSSGTLNELVTSTGLSYPADVQITSNTGETSGASWKIVPNATVSIRVPTSIIGTAMTTDTFVVIAGGQNGYGTGDWRWFDNLRQTPANNTTLAYSGGISTAPLSASLFAHYPNVYSYIAPAMVGEGSGTQQSLLSTYSSTSFATLEGITLPVTTHVTTHPAVLGASTIVNVSGDPEAFYAVGSQVYSSTSTDGINWSTPAPLVNLTFVPTGMAAVGGATPGLLAWNGTSYVFENVATGKFTNGTASGAIEAAAVTYASGAFYLALDVGGTVQVLAPGGSVLGSDAVSAAAVGLSTANGVTYLAYTTTTGLAVVTVTVSSTAATFGTSTVLTATLPTSSTVESLSLAAAPTGAVAVALAIKNASGSNIYLAAGTGNQTLKTITTDGQDFSPSVLLGLVSGVWEAYVGFTNLASGGNVFFLPSPVSAVVAPAPSPSPSIALWVWIVIAVVVILVIVGILVAVIMRRRRGGAKPAAPPTPWTPPSTETPGGAPPGEGTLPGAGTPPSSGGGTNP